MPQNTDHQLLPSSKFPPASLVSKIRSCPGIALPAVWVNRGCLGFLGVNKSSGFIMKYEGRMSRECDTFADHLKSATVQCW